MSDLPVPPASRFYALIETGRLECPRCGLILLFGYGAKHPDNRYWNPVSSVLSCRRCLARYQLGVIAWPVSKGGSVEKVSPVDQVADVRQLAELRQRTGGFWAYEKPGGGETVKDRPDRPRKAASLAQPVNRYVPEGCTCAPLPWRESCAVHGRVGWDRAAVHGGESEPESGVDQD